jgi:hypothetical protein
MSKQIDALKLALEALETIQLWMGRRGYELVPKEKAAITAIKEALAQPETIQKDASVDEQQGNKAAAVMPCGAVVSNVYEAYEAGKRAALAQPEQEPVAWMGTDIEGNPNKFRLNQFSGSFPLYAQPQPWTDDLALIAYLDGVRDGRESPQRTWVGLTDEEIWKDDAIMAANSGYGATFDTLRDIVRAIEVKLKANNERLEKNT